MNKQLISISVDIRRLIVFYFYLNTSSNNTVTNALTLIKFGNLFRTKASDLKKYILIEVAIKTIWI